VDLAYPFEGRWSTQNSPGSRVPSHGTTLLAAAYAIDFVPVDEAGRTAPITLGSLLRPEPPERFPGFGRPVLAPAEGTVVAVHDEAPDHGAFRGVPSIRYALTQPNPTSTSRRWIARILRGLPRWPSPSTATCRATATSSTLAGPEGAQLIRRSSPTGTRLMTNPSGTQGQAGTTADFFSFSIASTMACTPFSVEAMRGVLAEVPDISETM